MSNYPARLNALLKYFGKNKRHIAEVTGNTYDSVRSTTRPNAKVFPRNLKLAVWVFEEMRQKEYLVKESFGCEHHFIEIEGKGTQCSKCNVWI